MCTPLFEDMASPHGSQPKWPALDSVMSAFGHCGWLSSAAFRLMPVPDGLAVASPASGSAPSDAVSGGAEILGLWMVVRAWSNGIKLAESEGVKCWVIVDGIRTFHQALPRQSSSAGCQAEGLVTMRVRGPNLFSSGPSFSSALQRNQRPMDFGAAVYGLSSQRCWSAAPGVPLLEIQRRTLDNSARMNRNQGACSLSD